jgi:hypothetical protein
MPALIGFWIALTPTYRRSPPNTADTCWLDNAVFGLRRRSGFLLGLAVRLALARVPHTRPGAYNQGARLVAGLPRKLACWLTPSTILRITPKSGPMLAVAVAVAVAILR